MSNWPVEDIPNADSLFYRVSVGWMRPGDLKVSPGFFRENKGSISCDWNKYSTAAETRSRQGRPEQYAVIRMIAGLIRQIDGLAVVHSPIQNIAGQPGNRAHTSVFGLESPASARPNLGRKEKIRTELQKQFNSWEIPPNAPLD